MEDWGQSSSSRMYGPNADDTTVPRATTTHRKLPGKTVTITRSLLLLISMTQFRGAMD